MVLKLPPTLAQQTFMKTLPFHFKTQPTTKGCLPSCLCSSIWFECIEPFTPVIVHDSSSLCIFLSTNQPFCHCFDCSHVGCWIWLGWQSTWVSCIVPHQPDSWCQFDLWSQNCFSTSTDKKAVPTPLQTEEDCQDKHCWAQKKRRKLQAIISCSILGCQYLWLQSSNASESQI